jgi:bla regulator protein blaR1
MNILLDMLARNALAASLLAGLVLAASLLVKRPAVRNALWLVVLVRLLLPPVWSVPLFQIAAAVPETSVDPLAASSPAADAPVPSPLASSAGTGSQPSTSVLTASEMALPAQPEALPSKPSPVAAVGQTTLHILESLAPALFAVWALGTLFVVALTLVRMRRFQRELRSAIRAPEQTQIQTAEIARRLGLRHCPSVWLVAGRVPPLLWLPGLRPSRAKLVFPISLFAKLADSQRDTLLAHELAHLRRRDIWVRWLEVLATAIYWWHPLLGLIRRRLRESEEQCCDAWVVAVAERKAYATALMETVEFLDCPLVPAAPAFASGASPVHDLQRRLTMIMRGSTRGRLSRCGAIAILGVAMAALAVGPAFSNAQPDEPKDKKDHPFGPKRKDFKERFSKPDEAVAEELEKARQDLVKARDEAEKALKHYQELQERIQKAAEKKDEPAPKFGPPFGGMRGPAAQERQIQDLQKQVDQMKKMIDDLRKQLRPKEAEPKTERKATRPVFGLGGFGGFPGAMPHAFPSWPGGIPNWPNNALPGRKPAPDKEKLPAPRERPGDA